MKRPPRSPQESLFSQGLARHVIWVGLVIGLSALGIGAYYGDGANAAGSPQQTMIFTVLAFMQMGQALASRSTTASIFTLGLLSNPVLLTLVLITAVLQLAVIYVPFLDQFFQITPLTIGQLLLCMGMGLAMLLLIEIEKAWLRRREVDKQ
jgi:Ca2+-transporting ATPase